MIRRPPRSTLDRSSAASDVYKRQLLARLPYFLPSVVYDWTRDGLLAVALDENLIGLIDPDRGGVRLLGHNQGACTSVAWLG